MLAYFTNTVKRENSTLQPAITTSYNVVLKDASSIIRPRIELDRANAGHTYNYVYIPTFNRYYWVSDIVYDGAKVIYTLDSDVLASGKTAIGNSYQYVLRSAADNNGMLQDNLYPATGEIQQAVDSFTNPWLTYSVADDGTLGYLHGTFIVGILSSEGGTKYIAMCGLDFLNFSSWLLGQDFVKDTIGIWADTFSANAKLMVDPLQYISSVVWLPFEYTSEHTLDPNDEVFIGYTSTKGRWSLRPVYWSNSCYIDDTGGVIIWPQGLTTYTITPRQHPQAATRGGYLNDARYSKAVLYIPPFGEYDLDTQLISQYNTVSISGYIDLASGAFELIMVGHRGTPGNQEHYTIMRQSTQLGVTLPMSQIISAGFSPQTMVAPLTTAMMGDIPASALMLSGAIGTIIERQIPRARTTGQRGSFAGLRGNFEVVYTWHIVADDDNAQRGQPLCEVRQLSTLAGYQLIADADIRTTLTAEEDRKIKHYLESGYFYE